MTAPAGKRQHKKTFRLLRRAEFLGVAASGVRFVAPAFVLQKGKASAATPAAYVRYGLTATKKLGNAVMRNRARRRLRALAQKILLPRAMNGDYVLVARDGALTMPFDAIERDLLKALKVLKCLKDASPPPPGS